MDWFESFHDDLLQKTLLESRREEQQIAEDIHFLESVLHLPTDGHILDQCCGVGTLSHALSARGYTVHGVDFTESYIVQED